MASYRILYGEFVFYIDYDRQYAAVDLAKLIDHHQLDPRKRSIPQLTRSLRRQAIQHGFPMLGDGLRVYKNARPVQTWPGHLWARLGQDRAGIASPCRATLRHHLQQFRADLIRAWQLKRPNYEDAHDLWDHLYRHHCHLAVTPSNALTYIDQKSPAFWMEALTRSQDRNNEACHG